MIYRISIIKEAVNDTALRLIFDPVCRLFSSGYSAQSDGSCSQVYPGAYEEDQGCVFLKGQPELPHNVIPFQEGHAADPDWEVAEF